MRLFSKSHEEIEREREQSRRQELLKKLTLFPGSVKEYENFIGHDVEVVDNGRSNKGVILAYNGEDADFLISLMEISGVEALVNASFKFRWASRFNEVYGLPVRRKR